ncbi:achaete-scute complex protein T3-like [Coccinella septempunctata]|uniref:achaete-scute complex protein T3-like n=1 Tax=Coccinella septempunctata TaxID=41139 RepID=UPI001D080DF4|nr:achaete-scute complex protein T3-like [Coccinella septempunctata]
MATILQTMTLGQQTKMYNLVQQQSPQNNNCVIVPNSLQKQTVLSQKRAIAPNPVERTSVLVNNNNNNDLRCKRKIQFMPYGASPQQPASVARRNARERNRVKQVNNGFATLRQHIPAALASALSPQSGTGRGASKKLSKVETLRLAVEYIRSLQQLIDEHENDNTMNRVTNENAIDSRYYTNSPESLNQQYSYPILLPTPSCSEASVSPTPSQGSESSYSAVSGYTNNLYQETYESYEPKSPVDEELLDVIFSWQQEN